MFRRRRPSRKELASSNDWLTRRNAVLTEQIRCKTADAEQWERRALRLADDFVKRGRQDAEQMARLTDERDIALAALTQTAEPEAA